MIKNQNQKIKKILLDKDLYFFKNKIMLSKKTVFEVLANLWINLSSAWFSILLVSPGLFSIKSQQQYFNLLTTNLPLGILSLIVSFYLAELKNRL